jgi:hypothetical protein
MAQSHVVHARRIRMVAIFAASFMSGIAAALWR